jgi:hypothetical protein
MNSERRAYLMGTKNASEGDKQSAASNTHAEPTIVLRQGFMGFREPYRYADEKDKFPDNQEEKITNRE